MQHANITNYVWVLGPQEGKKIFVSLNNLFHFPNKYCFVCRRNNSFLEKSLFPEEIKKFVSRRNIVSFPEEKS